MCIKGTVFEYILTSVGSFTLPSSNTSNEEEAFAFSTLKAVVADVVPKPWIWAEPVNGKAEPPPPDDAKEADTLGNPSIDRSPDAEIEPVTVKPSVILADPDTVNL